MKILCVCNHGNVRSACMARELKDLNGPYKHDRIMLPEDNRIEAIAIGGHSTTTNTINMLIDWADKVWMFGETPITREQIQQIAGDKFTLFDIGPDKWANPFHPDLRSIMQEILKKEGLTNA